MRLRLRLWYFGLNVWDWDWDQLSIKFWDWDWDFSEWAQIIFIFCSRRINIIRINNNLLSKSSMKYGPAILPWKFGQNEVIFVCPKKMTAGKTFNNKWHGTWYQSLFKDCLLENENRTYVNMIFAKLSQAPAPAGWVWALFQAFLSHLADLPSFGECWPLAKFELAYNKVQQWCWQQILTNVNKNKC